MGIVRRLKICVIVYALSFTVGVSLYNLYLGFTKNHLQRKTAHAFDGAQDRLHRTLSTNISTDVSDERVKPRGVLSVNKDIPIALDRSTLTQKDTVNNHPLPLKSHHVKGPNNKRFRVITNNLQVKPPFHASQPQKAPFHVVHSTQPQKPFHVVRPNSKHINTPKPLFQDKNKINAQKQTFHVVNKTTRKPPVQEKNTRKPSILSKTTRKPPVRGRAPIRVYITNAAFIKNKTILNETLSGKLLPRHDASEECRTLKMAAGNTSIHRPKMTSGKVEDLLTMPPIPYLPNYANPCWREIHPSSHQCHLKCLPYFHLIGVCKSGTTDLFWRMRQHPLVLGNSGQENKETQWWAWRRFGLEVFELKPAGRRHNFSWYLGQFDNPAVEVDRTVARDRRFNKTHRHPLVIGESSPTTFWDLTGWMHIPQNNLSRPRFTTPHCMRHIQPHIRLLVLLRNPTERLYSDYLHVYEPFKNLSAQDFHNRVVKEVSRFNNCRSARGVRACVLDRGMVVGGWLQGLYKGFYAVYLTEWWSVFPKNQLLVLRTEDYERDIAGHLTKVYSFLGLPALPTKDLRKIASAKHIHTRPQVHAAIGPMYNITRRIVDKFYEPFNIHLAALTNNKRFLWT